MITTYTVSFVDMFSHILAYDLTGLITVTLKTLLMLVFGKPAYPFESVVRVKSV